MNGTNPINPQLAIKENWFVQHKILTGVIILIALAIIASALVLIFIPRVEDVVLTVDTAIDESTLTLQAYGTANLPDGTLLKYEVVQREDESVIEFEEESAQNLPPAEREEALADYRPRRLAEGYVEVEDGQWRTEEEIVVARWSRGELDVRVVFQTVLDGAVKQPRKIITRYGEQGENITGPQTAESAGLRKAEATKTLRKNPLF